MRHCCEFEPNDIYYLEETPIYTKRTLSIGFCPMCSKPVAELVEVRFDEKIEKVIVAGVRANKFAKKFKDKIVYSMKEANYNRFQSKPFGWKYGENKLVNTNGKIKIKQYACDFYGNKELVKVL